MAKLLAEYNFAFEGVSLSSNFSFTSIFVAFGYRITILVVSGYLDVMLGIYAKMPYPPLIFMCPGHGPALILPIV